MHFARCVLYFLSFILAILLVVVCCTYFFDQDLWNAGWEWAEGIGLSLAGCLHISYAVFFLTALMHFWGRYEKAQFMARVQDRNYVWSLVASGEQASEKLSEKLEYETKDEELRHKVSKRRLPEVIGALQKKLEDDKPIVEYDLLALKILLVDCANGHAVAAQAHAYLADLKDYADQEAHTQTVEEYADIRHRVEDTERKIYAQRHYNEKQSDSGEPEEEKVLAVLELREIVKEELLPKLTENEKLWTEGAAILKILRGACLAAIPLLLATGLIPMYMGEICMLSGIHWAILGVAGALVAVLRALGETKRLVVGNEQGVNEVQRAWWGAGLGLVAGLLTYMLVKSGFISCFLFGGPCVPDNMENQILVSGCFLEQVSRHQIYVHMLLAFLAGFAFERGIDRVRAAAGS